MYPAMIEQFISAVDAARKAGIDVTNEEHLKNYLKDTLAGTRPNSGFLYQNGPFSLNVETPIAATIQGGSPILNWIPTRSVSHRWENIAHLEWIAPNGFDGSQDYGTYLRSLTVEDCDYGPSVDWSGFEYQMSGGKFSFTSPVLGIDDFGVRDFQRQPIYTVRGSTPGLALSTDAEWATSRALMGMEQHANYNIVYGDSVNSVLEFDGIDTILTPGYVAARRVGPGTPHWANPLVVNGAALTTPADVLTAIRALVRKLRMRAQVRNWAMQASDMAIFMPLAMWPYLADAQASGGTASFLAWAGVNTMDMTVRDFLAERQRVTSGGVGFGFIEVDGIAVPVIPDGNLGRNVTIDPSGVNEAPGVTGDIYILTRRAAGITLLEQQYINYNELNYPTNGNETTFTLFNGLVRAGWSTINNKCFQYYAEMNGRLVSMFQPLQARINNVTIETLLENENEGGAFWSPDFYAYDGAQGGAGTALLTAI